MRRLRQAPDNPLRQVPRMMQLFPHFRHRVGPNGVVVWKGTLQPTPDSQVYRLRIRHTPGATPRFYVDRPRLREDVPHVYRDGRLKYLCLFWIEDWVWSPKESLADTLVLWAAFWLYYYEVWQEIGVWLGPESPHGQKMGSA